MNRGITFGFLLLTLAVSIFAVGNYQSIHATSTNSNTPKDSTATANTHDKNSNPSPKDSTATANTHDKNSNPQQDPTFLLPFNSNIASASSIPFP